MAFNSVIKILEQLTQLCKRPILTNLVNNYITSINMISYFWETALFCQNTLLNHTVLDEWGAINLVSSSTKQFNHTAPRWCKSDGHHSSTHQTTTKHSVTHRIIYPQQANFYTFLYKQFTTHKIYYNTYYTTVTYTQKAQKLPTYTYLTHTTSLVRVQNHWEHRWHQTDYLSLNYCMCTTANTD